MNEQGGSSRPLWHQPAKLTSQQRQEITQKYADGETAVNLALEYGVPASTVRSYCNPRK